MMKKVFKILGVFICVVGLIIFVKVSQNLIYSATSLTCLESKLEDSLHFGQALAITDKYIAVGDPEVNRVAIYGYNQSEKKWSRTREIYPPKNSIIDQVGSGFGKYLIFNHNQLIIGAFSDFVPSNFDEDTKNKYNYRGFVYSLQLEKDNQNPLKEINIPDQINPTGYAVKVFDNKIALETTVGRDYRKKPDKVLIVDPTTLKVESIIKPPILPTKRGNFGNSIAGNTRSLAISASDLPTKGGVYLVNEEGELETISISKILPTEKTEGFGSPVALGDDFLAIYSGGWDISIFKRFSDKWREIYSADLFGFRSLHADESQLLVSATGYPMDFDGWTKIPNHLLIDVQDDRAFIKSTIRWHWGIYFGRPKAEGAINSKYLLLSRNGKIVLLKKNYIPRNYVINRLFCKEK
ncbi:MAG: hypothetical protein RLZZ381_2253 [Cyanobacteriota bacterium]|jgi:hypothetical protein